MNTHSFFYSLLSYSVALAASTSVYCAPQFVQVKGGGALQTPQSVVELIYPQAQNGTDLNIVVVGWNDTSAKVTSVTDSSGNTYARAVGPTQLSGLVSQSIYYAKNIKWAAAGTNKVTVKFNTAAKRPDIRILEYSGIDVSNPIDATNSAKGKSTISSSGALRTRNAPDLLFAANTVQASGTQTAGTGYINRLITVPNGNITEDRIVTTTGSFTATANTTGGPWVMQLVAFKAALPPPPPSKVSLTGPASGIAGTCIGPFQIQSQDATNVGRPLLADTTVSITGLETAKMYNSPACTGDALAQMTLLAGSTNNFFYLIDTDYDKDAVPIQLNLVLGVSDPELMVPPPMVFAETAGPAARLIFSQQPSTETITNTSFAVQPIVKVQDAQGNLVANPQITLTLSPMSDDACAVAAGGTLSNGSASSVNGYAAFNAVSYSLVGNLYLKATSDTLSSACSNLISVGLPPNTPPVVDAGPDQEITLPASAALNGTASDDGLPNTPHSISYEWSTVSGPGSVNFTSTTNKTTFAGFSAPGVYVLRLTASDSQLSASDEIQITVAPSCSMTSTCVVNLSWDPSVDLVNNPQGNEYGYMILWGTQSGNYPNSLDVGNVLTAQVEGLGAGVYYFVAIAYYRWFDERGELRSVYSNEVSAEGNPPNPALTPVQPVEYRIVIDEKWKSTSKSKTSKEEPLIHLPAGT